MIERSISPRRNCSWFGLEKAATPEMIRHGMELIKKIIVDLRTTQRSSQIPDMTVSDVLRSGTEESVDFP